MKKRYVGFAAWLLLSCLLYFFENNTGTRIVLLCSLALPLIPAVRRGLFERDAVEKSPRPVPQTISAFTEREEDDPGGVRAYQPGDPVNRIHWKLSAKRDELLVRELASAAEKTEKQRASAEETPTEPRAKKRVYWVGCSAILAALLLLALLPAAREGMKALLNRLFEASEAINAYAYERFAVPENQPVGLAAAMLAAIAFSLAGMAAVSGSRFLGLCLMAGCVLFQAYFGLALPAWVNVPLFTLLSLWMLKRPWSRETALPLLAGVAAVSLAVLLFWHGVDAATEAASERARDRLSQMAESFTGAIRELPNSEHEARHAHTQSLTAGNQEAQADREFRLLTVEEEQISMPHWVNYLRVILLLLVAVAVVVLPFLPFALLNGKRKKALDARRVFQSENVNEAVAAIFQQVIRWLDATGRGAGNLPYAQWTPGLCASMSPAYAERFDQCEKLFEEAAYSAHAMREEQRRQAMALLDETEQALRRQADGRQRLRLKYREWLWI